VPEPREDPSTLDWERGSEQSLVHSNPASRCPALSHEQDSGHTEGAPALFGSHRASEPSLAVETEEHRLNVRNNRLDLGDDHHTTSWVEGEDVDRTPVATDRERDFNAYVVTEGLKSPNHNVDDRGVGLVE
jgi:hypothetical protein